jgi:xanthine dehydrogenase YagT iron-sulfur-binding subunit
VSLACGRELSDTEPRFGLTYAIASGIRIVDRNSNAAKEQKFALSGLHTCFRRSDFMAKHAGISRRTFFETAATTTASVALGQRTPAFAQTEAANPQGTATLRLVVNERDYQVAVDPRMTLLDMLREKLGLTGSKKGCDHGQCGACTVLVGERRVLSCLTMAASVREPVTTIEGLAGADGALHPLQKAFVQHDAFQCGYCTPGQIVAGVACIREGHAETDEMIREYMSGNICRCGAYPHIVEAIKQAKSEMERA